MENLIDLLGFRHFVSKVLFYVNITYEEALAVSRNRGQQVDG